MAAAGVAAGAEAARATGLSLAPAAPVDDPFPTSRDVFQWPFARDSIWNMPIGSAARYHDAGFQPLNPADPLATGDQYIARNGYRIEHEIICLRPDAPLTDVWWNAGSFNEAADRCTIMDDPSNGNRPRLLDRIPIPSNWTFHEGTNAGEGKVNGCFCGIRPADGSGTARELVGLFAFARCAPGTHAAARMVSSSTTGNWPLSWRLTGSDIFGEGRFGEHGGTHLSVLGGALRLGELRPGGGRIRHALKLILPQRVQWHAPDGANNWVWPAFNGDSNSGNQGFDQHVVQGALYALPPTLELAALGLETEPARQIAWTLQNYGAYCVDTTPAQTCAVGVEVGPAGDFREQFRADWGFPMERHVYTNPNIARLRQDYSGWSDGANTGPWIRDLDRVFSNLHVITNNGPNTIGGGGTPRQPLAPPFA
ncbi:hypothetical protein BU204_02705 [Actinophytocola xanthii]|uniref:Uncharacterized protein n=1 Tax=Actinophytocola xanthii TaxID=1912961 RepID=A0A1Q8CY37_9PSEU|nr:hypothetical protein BU204_02705 [Actinophytocola xanthii]